MIGGQVKQRIWIQAESEAWSGVWSHVAPAVQGRVELQGQMRVQNRVDRMILDLLNAQATMVIRKQIRRDELGR